MLAKAIYRSMVSVDKFINYTHTDGACEEGPSYWGHAAGKMFDYLELLSAVTGGTVSIFDNPMIKNMGEYISRSYVGKGWVVNFADASAKGSGDAPLIFRYGKAVNSNEMKGFAAMINTNKLPSGRDIYACCYKNCERTKRNSSDTSDSPILLVSGNRILLYN